MEDQGRQEKKDKMVKLDRIKDKILVKEKKQMMKKMMIQRKMKLLMMKKNNMRTIMLMDKIINKIQDLKKVNKNEHYQIQMYLRTTKCFKTILEIKLCQII